MIFNDGQSEAFSDTPKGVVPDFAFLAQAALSSSLKTQRQAWPQLVYYGLFEPHFFAAARQKAQRLVPESPISDASLAESIVKVGLRLLIAEKDGQAGNYPLHAAAMLLAFPQVRSLPAPDKRNTSGGADLSPEPFLVSGAHKLDDYWTRSFPDLQSSTIDRMLSTQLLQRKAGAPTSYHSLTSSHHTAQFRRIAALSLVDRDEITRRVDKPLPSFSIKWGETIRATTERPLFLSLIADFYRTVYDHIEVDVLCADNAGNTRQRRLTPVAVRYALCLTCALLPTAYNALTSQRSLPQLLFDSCATNLASAALVAACIGYIQQLLIGEDKPYRKWLLEVGAASAGLILAASLIWSTQENFTWPFYDGTYRLLNTVFLAAMLFTTTAHFALYILIGVHIMGKAHYESARQPLRYPALPLSFLLLFCAAYLLPPIFLPNAGLNYSPTAGSFLVWLTLLFPLMAYVFMLLVNHALTGKLRFSRLGLVGLHFLGGVSLLLAHQAAPRNRVSWLSVFAAAALFTSMLLPLLLKLRKTQK